MQELDQLTQELYNCVCFKKGGKPDFKKLKALFFGEGKLINNSGSKPKAFTAEQFEQDVLHQIKLEGIEAFHEREVAHKTEVFGKVAQRFSTYEARFDETNPDPLVVGVNCIQFIQVDDKWLISSMVWDDETK